MNYNKPKIIVLISVLILVIVGGYLFLGIFREHKVSTGLEGHTYIVNKTFFLAPLTHKIDSATYTIEINNNANENFDVIIDNSQHGQVDSDGTIIDNFYMNPYVIMNEGTKLKVKEVTYKNYFEGERHMINVEIENIAEKTYIYYNSDCFKSVRNNKLFAFFKINRHENIGEECIFQNNFLQKID
ncbi:MAG: hypothetical protein WCX08_03345 [Candidatus Buchananbacteria bacterium]|jgi:hypothetical protein